MFRHSTLGFQAVKVGFSWPGCLFSILWVFVKKTLGYGFGILGIIILFTFFGVYFFVGFKGNEWRVSNLQKRRFELVDTLQAENPDAGIGKVAKICVRFVLGCDLYEPYFQEKVIMKSNGPRNIKLSRHAKRRAKLYGIAESTVTAILANMNLLQGEHEIIKNVAGIEYPLKIVVSVEKDTITVIANYPLKKGRKR